MKNYYEEIMNLPGADEFKAIIKKWDTLSNNIKKYPLNAPVLLPDMLWVAPPGIGRTNLLELMSEYLYSKENLMEFYGDVKFFEFYFGYSQIANPMSDLQRLMDEVSNAAGFRSEFKGIIHVNADEWADRFEDANFVALMEYLSANSDNWLVVLSVLPGHKRLHDFKAFVSMYLRLEILNFSLPETDKLFDRINYNLASYGLSFDESAKALLSKSLDVMRENKYFDGYKTIDLLCQDIVYKFFSRKSVKNYVLTEKDVEDFAFDGEYVKRTVINSEKKVHKIGLIGEE